MEDEKVNNTSKVQAGAESGHRSASCGEKYTGNTKKEEWYNPKYIGDYDIESYIEKRWGDQFNYFEDRAKYNRTWYNRIQVWIILLGSLSVAFLSFDFGAYDKFSKFVCALMSCTIVVLTGYDKLKQFNLEWINKRKAQEQLKTEICKFKFGVEPYTAPAIEQTDESDKQPIEKDLKSVTSERTKTLLAKLNEIVSKYDEVSFVNTYKNIKNEISSFLSLSNDYDGKSGDITDKDKIFVSRVNADLEECQRLVYEGNIFRVIKNEISDFYTNSGAYKVGHSVQSKKNYSRNEILANNERLFVARIESIIAQDVDSFVTAKNKNSESKQFDGKEK